MAGRAHLCSSAGTTEGAGVRRISSRGDTGNLPVVTAMSNMRHAHRTSQTPVLQAVCEAHPDGAAAVSELEAKADEILLGEPELRAARDDESRHVLERRKALVLGPEPGVLHRLLDVICDRGAGRTSLAHGSEVSNFANPNHYARRA